MENIRRAKTNKNHRKWEVYLIIMIDWGAIFYVKNNNGNNAE